MRYAVGSILLVGSLMLATQACAAARDDAWENLRHVTRRRNYTVVDRQSKCAVGRILSVTDHSVTLRTSQTATITVERANVLRVSDGPHTNDMVYSARSSWSDVQSIPKNSRETARVVTKDGKEHEGKILEASEIHLILLLSGKRVELAKDDISRVEYVRYKPLSESGQFAAQEMYFVDPELWPYFLNIGVKMSVRLYDVSMPESNAPIHCG
ncbi:MAG: hypothetical protein WCE53_09155 [Candidatus Acidiferrum sp.]